MPPFERKPIAVVGKTLTGPREIKPVGKDLPAGSDLERSLGADVDAIDKHLQKTDYQRQLDEASQKVLRQYEAEVDPAFYLCVVFQTRGQKIDFLVGSEWESIDFTYVSGTHLAEKMGIALEPGVVWRPVPKIKERWAALAMPIEDDAPDVPMCACGLPCAHVAPTSPFPSP